MVLGEDVGEGMDVIAFTSGWLNLDDMLEDLSWKSSEAVFIPVTLQNT